MHIILIPAYEPDGRLIELVQRLAGTAPVVVVDDGSGRRFADVFDFASAAGAHVLTHARNRGKGAALRTGFAFIQERWPGATVVTADADGQHTPADIRRVASAAELTRTGTRPTIVLGARGFTGDVPRRSRIGNTVTRWAFRIAAGQRLSDTQTGLRGYPAETLPWLQSLPGDRFEYEFSQLLQARSAGIDLVEVPIETVYLDSNASSHFRPWADSLRIYAPLLRFTASALLAFGIDTIALLVLHALTGSLLAAVVGARILSAGVNFGVNRALVFRGGRDVPVRTAAARYFSLAGLLLLAGYGLLTSLTEIGIGLLPAKVLTEITLFAVSFAVQRAIVFAPAPAPVAARMLVSAGRE